MKGSVFMISLFKFIEEKSNGSSAKKEVTTVKYLNHKNRIKSTVATLVSVVVCMCIAVCMISAVSNDNSGEPLLTAADVQIRVNAPQIDTVVSIENIHTNETAETTNRVITIISDTPVFATPEFDTEKETQAPETTAAETTAVETTAEETTAPAPDTTAQEAEAPVTEASETTPLPSKETSANRLVDELGVPYAIVPQTRVVTEEEIILTATVVQLEVMGNGSSLYRFEDVQEKYWEMLSVAQCIRNRADSRYFPNSPWDVITQSHTTPSGRVIYQFSPAEKLARFTPTAEAITAAREVLLDGVSVLPSNYYYF